MMRAAPTSLALCLAAGLAPAPAAAQSWPGTPTTAVAHSCTECHSPHPGTRTAYALRLGSAGATVGLRVAGLGYASVACMRCHATAEVRQREGGGVAGIASASGVVGKYLGLDLSAGHPLGRARPDAVTRTGLLNPLAQAERQAAAQIRRDPSIGCPDCHDPHDRTPGWTDADERACARCHDDRRYRFTKHVTVSCGSCHRLHGGSQPGLVATRDPDQVCVTCHQTPGRAADPRMTRTLPGPQGHVVTTAQRCVECHPPHAALP